MHNIDFFKNKKITIVGLARSGLSCANLLCKLGAQVSITEKSDNDAIRVNLSRLESKEIKVELGAHTEKFIEKRDLIVVSPGVGEDAMPLVWAKQAGIPAVSEIEVASVLCPGTVIATTGTCGKTTVTTLIGRVFTASSKRCFVCGNIGNPFSGEVEKIGPEDFVSLEVSSFQLQRIETFKPRVAVLLNFTRNHLDRHKDMQEYLDSKKRIFKNQDKNDYLIINADDSIITNLAAGAVAKTIYFRKDNSLNPNQAAVLAVASIFDIGKDTVMRVFEDFKGLEHRMEEVASIKGVRFINDSKATTVDSTAWALNNTEGAVLLIAGGRDKGNDYGVIRDLMRKKVKQIIAIGESKEKLKGALSPSLAVSFAQTLEEAVRQAFSRARAGDCVLLSPMCASFDMFSNYEERGRAFKKAVGDLVRDGS